MHEFFLNVYCCALSAQEAGSSGRPRVYMTGTEVTRRDHIGLKNFWRQKWPHLIGQGTHGNSAHGTTLSSIYFCSCRSPEWSVLHIDKQLINLRTVLHLE